MVTLDRVKKIDIEEDFGVWKEYAYRRGIHGAILSYLEIRREHFYRVETPPTDCSLSPHAAGRICPS